MSGTKKSHVCIKLREEVIYVDVVHLIEEKTPIRQVIPGLTLSSVSPYSCLFVILINRR